MKATVPTPDPKEQRQIAYVLDATDRAIRASEDVIAKLEMMKLGLLHDLMCDLSGDPKELATLFADIHPGVWGAEPRGDGEDTPVLGSTSIRDDGSLMLETATLRRLTPKEQTRRRLRSGDVLLEASGGAPNRPVGRTAAFISPLEKTFVGSNFVRILRPAADVDPGFIAWYLWWIYRTPAISRFQQQTTGISNLNVREYIKQTVRLPAVAEQKRIREALDASQATIVSNRNEAEKRRLLKQGLMDDLLTGRVRVTSCLVGHAT